MPCPKNLNTTDFSDYKDFNLCKSVQSVVCVDNPVDKYQKMVDNPVKSRKTSIKNFLLT